MLPWLLTLVFLLQPNLNRCIAAPTSSGPVSESEANVLWEEGFKAYSQSHYQEAISFLQRYIDRYPGKPHYLKAHLFLGKAFNEVEKYASAIPVLKNYIASSSNLNSLKQARIWLEDAYLGQKKYQEALLLSLELDAMADKNLLSQDLLYHSLLNKTQALAGLKRQERATQLMETIEEGVLNAKNPTLTNRFYSLQLNLKNTQCAQFPTPEQLDESQLRNQLERRGLCLLESLLIYRKILKNGDPNSTILGAEQVMNAFDQYAQSCISPISLSIPTSPKRTPLEAKRYHTELIDQLKQDCRKKSIAALDLLSSWKAGLSETSVRALVQTSQNLEQFLSSQSHLHPNQLQKPHGTKRTP